MKYVACLDQRGEKNNDKIAEKLNAWSESLKQKISDGKIITAFKPTPVKHKIFLD